MYKTNFMKINLNSLKITNFGNCYINKNDNGIKAHCPHHASTLTSIDTNPLKWSQAPLALERPDLNISFFYGIFWQSSKLNLVLYFQFLHNLARKPYKTKETHYDEETLHISSPIVFTIEKIVFTNEQ